ncbi:DUF927 domain-containing protein [Roseomonas elaeocarpi]|uniref:DUF927 domain-containing protein n=1 Tax=Roseomonas elaeocarpi TaxID=907779 RepID=A0ABV6JZ06_9PROT
MSEQTSPDAFAPLTEVMPLLNGKTHAAAPTGMSRDTEELWEPQDASSSTIPSTSKLVHPAHGSAAARWVYRDAKGTPLFIIARFDKVKADQDAKQGKEFLPYSYGRRVWTSRDGKRQDRTGWHCKAAPTPRALYGLDQLAERPDAPVLVVEGEKTANRAQERFPDHVCITSAGGSKASGKTEWAPLARRHIVIWADRDDPGQTYGDEAARRCKSAKAASVRVVQVPQGWPEGWDLADALPSGVTEEHLRELLDEAEDADPPHLPEGFQFKETGLFFYPENEDAERVFVSAPFDVIGEANDGAGLDWGVVIGWHDRDGRKHQWSVPQRLVHSDGNGIAEELASAGLHVGTSGRARGLLKQFIAGVRSQQRLTCVDRTGWHSCRGNNVFIMPGGEAYGPGSRRVILQTERAASDTAFQSAETLEAWQQQVARYAVGNDRLLLAISLAFTTPLLDVVHGDSGGIHFQGMSRTGKTTLLVCAGSVWGRGDGSGQVRQWRATANGLESIASETSDTLLVLDEIGQANANDVADTVYMLANGAGKVRGQRQGGARPTKTWRTMYLSTGEITLAAKMAESGKRIMAGLEIRLLNIPSDAGAGMGAFQYLHNLQTPAELSKHLTHAAKTTYGTAGRAFLSRLVRERARDGKAIGARLKKAQDDFAARYVPSDSSGQVRNAADRFSLIGAAGELAREYDVLPWPKGEGMRAAAACFKAWLEERGGTGSSEDELAVAQVQAFLEAHGEARFTPLTARFGGEVEPPEASSQRTHQRAGWRRRPKGEEEGWEYLVLPQVWTNEVCRGLEARQVASVLRKRGLLLGGTAKSSSSLQHIPREGSVRVYRISGSILGQAEGEADEVED